MVQGSILNGKAILAVDDEPDVLTVAKASPHEAKERGDHSRI